MSPNDALFPGGPNDDPSFIDPDHFEAPDEFYDLNLAYFEAINSYENEIYRMKGEL